MRALESLLLKNLLAIAASLVAVSLWLPINSLVRVIEKEIEEAAAENNELAQIFVQERS